MAPSLLADETRASLRSGRRQRIKPEVWAQHRPAIVALYDGQGMTLPETRAIMEKQYNFQASEKQYKDKFKAWDLKKKNLGSDYRFMIRKERERRYAPYKKCTLFRVNDKDVSSAKIRRYERDKGIRPDDILHPPIATPPHITYSTPCPTAWGEQPPAPRNVEAQEGQVLEDEHSLIVTGPSADLDEENTIGQILPSTEDPSTLSHPTSAQIPRAAEQYYFPDEHGPGIVALHVLEKTVYSKDGELIHNTGTLQSADIEVEDLHIGQLLIDSKAPDHKPQVGITPTGSFAQSSPTSNDIRQWLFDFGDCSPNEIALDQKSQETDTLFDTFRSLALEETNGRHSTQAKESEQQSRRTGPAISSRDASSIYNDPPEWSDYLLQDEWYSRQSGDLAFPIDYPLYNVPDFSIDFWYGPGPLCDYYPYTADIYEAPLTN